MVGTQDTCRLDITFQESIRVLLMVLTNVSNAWVVVACVTVLFFPWVGEVSWGTSLLPSLSPPFPLPAPSIHFPRAATQARVVVIFRVNDSQLTLKMTILFRQQSYTVHVLKTWFTCRPYPTYMYMYCLLVYSNTKMQQFLIDDIWGGGHWGVLNTATPQKISGNTASRKNPENWPKRKKGFDTTTSQVIYRFTEHHRFRNTNTASRRIYDHRNVQVFSPQHRKPQCPPLTIYKCILVYRFRIVTTM